mgnify:FL=1
MPSLKTINVLRYKKKINRPGSKEIILPCLGAEFVRQTPKIIKFIIIIGTARAHSNWALSESSSILNTLSKDSSSESFSLKSVVNFLKELTKEFGEAASKKIFPFTNSKSVALFFSINLSLSAEIIDIPFALSSMKML